MELEIMLIIFGAVLLLIGLVFMIPYKVVSRLKGVTEGEIKDMTIDAGTFNNDMEERYQQSTHRKEMGPVTFTAEVGNRSHFDLKGANAVTYHAVYAYTVNNVEYVRADGIGYNKGQIIKKIGKKVKVYYDPANPLRASLSSGKVYLYLSIGLSILGIILMLAYLLIVVL